MTVKFRGGWRLLMWFAGIGLMLAFLASQLHLVSDIKQFMPTARHDPQLQTLMDELQSGPAATTLMLNIYGADAVQLSSLSKQLHQHLSTQSLAIRKVYNGEVVQEWQALDVLFPYRYLLNDQANWSVAGIRRTFEQRVKDLQLGGGAFLSNYIVTDPQLQFLQYLRRLSDVAGPAMRHGVWFDPEGKSALLLVRVNSESLDLDVMQNVVADIHQTFATIAVGSTAQLEIVGPGMMAVATRSAIHQVTHQLTVIMVVLLVGVFMVAYRSLRLLWLIGVPLLSAVLAALVMTQILFGEVHGIVIILGVTTLGVCVDYPIYLFSHLHSSETPHASMSRIWPTLRMGGIIMVLAFLALLGSGFTGLNQLAVFTACGLVMALLVTRYLMVYLVAPEWINPRLWWVDIRLSKQQQFFSVGLLLLILLSSMLFADVFWERSAEAISPVPAAVRERDRTLRHALGVAEISHVFMLSGNDLELVLQSTEAVDRELSQARDAGIISGWWSAAQILPSKQMQQYRQAELPAVATLSQNIKEALDGLPFRRAALSPWLDAVVVSRDMQPIGYEKIMSTPLSEVLPQRLFRHDEQWISLIRVAGIRSDADLLGWLEGHPVVKTTHVQIKQATARLLTEYRSATFARLIIIVIILASIVLLWSRSFLRTGRILLPVAIGIVTGLAVPLWLGNAINVFHLISLLLVMGIGLNYSLFLNQMGGDKRERGMRLHAISISAVTNSAAFAIIAFSSVPVLAAIGQTVSAGILMCFLLAWLQAARTADNIGENA